MATGLVVCETVSALRFARVRRHTDVPVARACLELFLRDEVAHARLGFLLLPLAVANHAASVGSEKAHEDLSAELAQTFRYLDEAVGLDAERTGLALETRPQPTPNAGVVEPMIDALAFYDAVQGTIAPRLARLGVDASQPFAARWS